MIVTCPECSTQFKLDPALLGQDGKKVKCASCEHIWLQKPEIEGAEDTEPSDDIQDAESQDSDTQGAETKDPEAKEADAFDEVLNELEGKIEAEDDPETEPQVEAEPEPESNADVDEKIEASKEKQDEDDIPEAVKPQKDDEPEVKNHSLEETFKSRLIAYGVVACVFVASFIPIFAFSQSVMKDWKTAIPFYEFFGVTPPAYGEGLVFDRITVEKVDDYNLNIEGYILNLTLREQPVPFIRAMLIDRFGAPVSTWFIDLDDDVLQAENTLGFSSNYSGLNQDAERLELKFVLELPETMKARETDGRNLMEEFKNKMDKEQVIGDQDQEHTEASKETPKANQE